MYWLHCGTDVCPHSTYLIDTSYQLDFFTYHLEVIAHVDITLPNSLDTWPSLVYAHSILAVGLLVAIQKCRIHRQESCADHDSD
ncbi:hypothetical protein P691DRAFT_805480, partial [Macrolepiota fuliginosa MF-IS2]